jgi:hypothetical protein
VGFLLNVRLINADQQPTGGFRVLDWLQSCLVNPDYTNFKCAVAFAKINPLLKLDRQIVDWRASAKTLEAIVGIDHQGTSVQALAYMLEHFSGIHLLHTAYSTFHPKMYLFYGAYRAAFYVGSNNLTPGGLETNFESGVLIELTIADDPEFFTQLLASFDDLLPGRNAACVPLTRTLLDHLFIHGLLMNEAPREREAGAPPLERRGPSASAILGEIFGTFHVRPPRPIPRGTVERIVRANRGPRAPHATTPIEQAPRVVASGFVIQIAPHHNGEVFLSKMAINQNPDFFGFPFTGMTTPRIATNPSYPQRVPDPVVNITAYDGTGALAYQVAGYNLNTVFYAPKAEIRITISPEILAHVPEYSILVMTNSDEESYDYDMTIFAPGSDRYSEYLAVCDQTLPSGGRLPARRMGWL